MDNTKIDWADMSWNPVTGCRHGCPYCYARRIAERFSGKKVLKYGVRTVLEEPVYINGKIAPYPFGFMPTLHRYRLGEPARKQRPRNIFVCSMADLFGNWVPTHWIKEVLDACLAAPQHNYMFLTKNPQRYVELDKLALLPRLDNFWYGTTVMDGGEPFFTSGDFKTFYSIEPMMGPIFPSWDGLYGADWVIVGAETGNRKDKVTPERAWVEDLLEVCRIEGVPLFMKGNLADVWGEQLIQEYPEQLRHE